MSINRYDVSFDSIQLTSITGLSILDTDPYAPALRKLNIFDIARTNKGKTSSAFYNQRVIKVGVIIQRDTRALLEQSIDSLMTILQGLEKDLIVPQGVNTRRYICTLLASRIKKFTNKTAWLDLEFTCSEHFGYDIPLTTLLQVSGFTSGQKTDQLTVGGSAPWQVPIVTVTISAVTGGTTKAVTIGNDATGQRVSVTRTWTALDVLIVNAYNQTVKVNGVEVAFSGAIPEWAPGVGYLTYTDAFTSRTMSMTVQYYKRFV